MDTYPIWTNPVLSNPSPFAWSDSVPSQVVREWESELAFTDNAAPDDPRRVELHKRVDRYMDMGHGACFLRDDRIAELVKSAYWRESSCLTTCMR